MPENIATVLRSATTLPAGVIPVADTEGFNPSGQIALNTEDSTLVVVTYTGKTATAFTGASGGSGVFAPGTLVVQLASNDDLIKAKSRRYRGYRQSEIVDVRIVADDAGIGGGGGGTGGIIEYDNGTGTGVNVSASTPLPVTGTFVPTTSFANNSGVLTYTAIAVNGSATNSRTGVAYRLRGFTGTGNGDGEWSLQINSTEVAFGYTNVLNRVETVYLGNPISILSSDTVSLVVTNRGDATTNYRGIILGE
jgi:hypothetical protein